MSTAASVINNLLAVADVTGTVHGVQPEAVLLQMLALGSALAGDLVSSKPAGTAVAAKFSLLVRTADAQAPPWIAGEWNYLASRQDAVLKAPPNPLYGTDRIGQLRRKKRILKLLNPGDDEELRMIDAYMACVQNRKTFRHFHLVGKGACPAPGAGAAPGASPAPGAAAAHGSLTLAASGIRELRRILRTRNQPEGFWSLLNNAAGRSNLLAWVSLPHWRELVREAGADLHRLGLVIDCPATGFNPDLHADPKVTAASLLSLLESARFGSIRYALQPCDQARELLHMQAAQIPALMAKLPEAQRAQALPDRHLAWHLAALLAALCCEDTGVDATIAVYEATKLGVALAAWAIHQHLHHFRHTLPADDQGPFTGQDLHVLRFLTAVPAPVRQFQRRLRSVDKESCLRSLRRALNAGLAIETEPGRFSAQPPPGQGLSDFLSEFRPDPVAQAGFQPLFPDFPDMHATPGRP